ncbi:MAG: hypothetical protein ACP5U0_08415 [Caldisphaera sp.]
MFEQIRIYCESIEQGADYIRPIIEESIKRNKIKADVLIVRLKRNFSLFSKKVAPIIFWKNPDILITAISKGIEYPLMQIEFSNAVFTEDHELQRFDGMVASAENNCIYVKISPIHKRSQSEHGGNTDFDYRGPFALIFKKYGKVFFHFDWPCDGRGIVEVDDTYLSVPKKIDEFNILIDALMAFAAKENIDDIKWDNKFYGMISKIGFFKTWMTSLEKFELPKMSELNSSRTEWKPDQNELILKLNRFGHSMDPERGMLSYYGQLSEKTSAKMMFSVQNNAWYKDTPNEAAIETYVRKNGLNVGFDFLYCFMMGAGLDNNREFQEMILKYKSDKSAALKIDITRFLKKNYLILNKALRTIFKNSRRFFVVDNKNVERIGLIWKPFKKDENYSKLMNVTPIKNRENFDEDDVTYITIHNVLKANKFIILAVSYPGAQGDRVVLIAPGTGRRQERRYVDVISYLPNKFTSLQENKGAFSSKGAKDDITRLKKYKTENKYKDAINNFIDRFDQSAPKIVKIGVGFWANAKFTPAKLKEVDMKDLDYFVYLTSDMKEWIIWSTGKGSMFTTTKGKIIIPTSFEIIEGINSKQEKLT